MRCIRSLLLAALSVACVAAATEVFAQVGYYRNYSSYYYPRPYNNTYHGYWRDQGYGFSNQPYYGGYRYSTGYFHGPGYSPYYGPSQYGGYGVPSGPQFNFYYGR